MPRHTKFNGMTGKTHTQELNDKRRKTWDLKQMNRCIESGMKYDVVEVRCVDCGHEMTVVCTKKKHSTNGALLTIKLHVAR